MSDTMIEIWVPKHSEDTKAALPKLGRAAHIETTYVEASVLSANLKEFLNHFQAVLEDQSKSPSGYYVEEIELNIGVSGKGGIALIGKLEAGLEAGIKVKLRRKNERT